MPTPARCASLLLLLAVAASCIALAAGAALHVSARGQAPPARNASTLRKNPHPGTTNTIVLAGRHVELLALLPNQRRVWQSPAIGPEGVYVWMAAVLPGGDVVAMVLPENNADEDADLRLAAGRGDMSSIVRLDGSSGEVVWRWAPPKGNMVISTPLIRGPNMYLALCTDPLKGKVSSALEAHSLADASRVWSLDLGTLENDAWGMMRAGPIADGETNIYMAQVDKIYEQVPLTQAVYSNATQKPVPSSPATFDLMSPDGRATFAFETETIRGGETVVAVRRLDASGKVTNTFAVAADSDLGSDLSGFHFSGDSSILFHAVYAYDSQTSTYNSTLEAFDVGGDEPSCAKLWSLENPKDCFFAWPELLIAGVDSIIGMAGKTVAAYDAKTGQTKWVSEKLPTDIAVNYYSSSLALGPLDGSTGTLTVTLVPVGSNNNLATGRLQSQEHQDAEPQEAPQTAIFVLDANTGSILSGGHYELPLRWSSTVPPCVLPANTVSGAYTNGNTCLFAGV